MMTEKKKKLDILRRVKVRNKVFLVETIYQRFGKALKRKIIEDAIAVMIFYIENEILEDRIVSIPNFVTMYPFTRPGRIIPGKYQFSRSSRAVRLKSSVSFKEMVKDRRQEFLRVTKKNP